MLLNVLMAKMVQDWFAGREIATAMAVFVTSWPVGIALALVALPPLAAAQGASAGFAATVAVTAAALVAFRLLYREAPVAGGAGSGGWPAGPALVGILLAGTIWGFYNSALALVFGFGPTLLVAADLTLLQASFVTSLVLWTSAISVPMGGVIGDRTGRPDAVLVTGITGFCVTLALALAGAPPMPIFILMGALLGLSAGPIMTLPARVLAPDTRATGMGIFFTIYYGSMVLTPVLAGLFSDLSGSPAAAFVMALALLLASLACLPIFQLFSRGGAASPNQGHQGSRRPGE